jgi:short-subunit dehydrogenase
MTMATAPAHHHRRRSHRDLAGTRAIVTGASSGVGRALALELVRRGGRVVATARRRERLEELAAEAAEIAGPGSPPPVVAEPGDITDAEFRHRLVDVAVARLGGLDLVAAVAGGGAVGPFAAADPTTLARVLELNFTSPAELVRLAVPALETGRDPAIVLVGSILGYHPLPLHADYCAAKAAVRSLATALRMELAPRGIDVMLVSLGPVTTEFWDQLATGRRPAWSRGRPLSAAAAAAAIATGLVRRRREILPGWRARSYALLARWLPDLLTRGIVRQAAGDPHLEGHAT